MTNAKDTKISYIPFTSGSNGLSDFSILGQYNKVTYFADIAYKARFVSLANVFVAQLYNISS